jgi:hypothetical protein
MMRYLLLTAMSLLATAGLLLSTGSAHDLDEQKLNVIARDFRERLGISEPVTVTLTDVGKRLVSVERAPGSRSAFLIKFDREFYTTLIEEELRAAIAHEMGHVWIFTHHPFLHTEPLANEKARELVTAESLARVYEKVWKQEGSKGTLAEFLGKVDTAR